MNLALNENYFYIKQLLHLSHQSYQYIFALAWQILYLYPSDLKMHQFYVS